MNETVVPGIAVLRTRLPYVDRRSLSEAWFSALHVARTDAPTREAGSRPAACGNVSVPHPKRARPVSHLAPARTVGIARYAATVRSAHDAVPSGVDLDDAAAPMPRLRRAAAQARSYPARRTSLTVGVDGARVQLLLRREGNVLHVVALCRPGIAEVVSRALACAHAHLRSRGDALRASVRTYEPAVRA